MTAELRWTRLARSDLMVIYVAIGRDSPKAAEAVFARLETRILSLREQPRMGSRRADLRPTMRVPVESPYLIMYETYPDAEDERAQWVEIIRVLDGRRDLTTLV